MKFGICVRLRGGTYQWRKRLPHGVATRLGKTELILSLRTGDNKRAVRLATILNLRVDQLISMVETHNALTPEQLNQLVRRWLRIELAEAERLLAMNGERTVERNKEGQAQGQQFLQELSDALASNDLLKAKVSVDTLLNGERLTLAEDSSEYRQLCRLLLRAAAEGARQIQARLEGRYDGGPSDPLFAHIEATAPASPTALPAIQAPAEPGPRLEELIERHLTSSARKWETHTLKQNRATFRMLRELVGDIPADKLDRRKVAEFVEALALLPSRYGQTPAYRRKTLPQMLEIARKGPPSVPRLSQKTLNRHVSAVSGLFTWAKQQGRWARENPASGFIDKRQGGEGPARRPWRKDELERLFAAPPWAGCKSAAQRLVPGKAVIRDAYFFIPLIALFTGMRLEEICKLTLADLRTEGDIALIDVVGNAEGRLKEEVSNRTVPIHPELHKLGLLDHAERIRKAGGGRLWPELGRTGKSEKLGTAFTKWFSRLKKDAGIAEQTVVFHSFRRNVATGLHAAGVAESTVADILGHEHRSMSYRLYSAGAAIKPLYDAICKIESPIDFSGLHIMDVTSSG